MRRAPPLALLPALCALLGGIGGGLFAYTGRNASIFGDQTEMPGYIRADAALYLAKQRGRNAVVLAPPGPAEVPPALAPGPRLQSP